MLEFDVPVFLKINNQKICLVEIFLSLNVKFLICSDGFSETPSPTSSGASPLSPPGGGGGGDGHQKSPPPPPPPQPPSKASTSYQQRFTRVPPPRYRPHQPPSVPKMGGGPPLGTSNSGLQQSQPIQQQARTSVGGGGRAVLRHDQRSEKSYSAENIMVAGRQQQQVCPLTTKIKLKQYNLSTFLSQHLLKVSKSGKLAFISSHL